MKKSSAQFGIFLILSIFLHFCSSKQEMPVLTNPNVQSLVTNFNKVNFNKQFGNDVVLDFTKSIEIEIMYLGIPEKYIVTPVLYNNGKTFGNMFSLKNTDATFKSLIVNSSNYNKENGAGTIAYQCVGISKHVSFVIEKFKIANMLDTDVTFGQVKSNSTQVNLGPSCTGSCYKTAKDACDNNPDCKMLCDVLPTCNTTIAASCFLHCFFL